MAYLHTLPSKKNIVLFFYDGNISHDIAFGNLLTSGDLLANRLTLPFNREEGCSSHIAVDGETFGDHHKFGEMALAYCFLKLEKEKNIKICIYAHYLEKTNIISEVWNFMKILRGAVHMGLEGGAEIAGAVSITKSSLESKMERIFKKSAGLLRMGIIPLYEKKMAMFVKDPWAVRDKYIDLILIDLKKK